MNAVIRRYTDGFIEYAKETMGLEKGLEDLKDVRRVLRDNPDFWEFLESPNITRPEKEREIDTVFQEGFSEEIRQFLKLLLRKGRINEFANIAEYARIKYAHGKEVDAILNASYPLDTDVMQRIKDILERRLQKKLHLYVNLDPALLGGVRVTIGNTVIDGSVRKRFEDLRLKLLAAKVS